MNEREVRDAFREALVRYCAVANATGGSSALNVTVTTSDPLSEGTQEWIYHLSRAHARQDLMAMRDPILSFPYVTGMAAPGYRFLFHPPALPGQRETVELPGQRRSGPVALLTLRYEPGFVWPCRIGAATDWLALGRWTDSPVRTSAMQLPTYATWLPRGPLLLVHNQDGRFAFGRSRARPQYEIRVDGTPLPPGGSVAAGQRGSIEYTSGPASTRLGYSVGWEARDGR